MELRVLIAILRSKEARLKAAMELDGQEIEIKLLTAEINSLKQYIEWLKEIKGMY